MKFFYKHTLSFRYIFTLLYILHVSKAERRIIDGRPLTFDRSYVVSNRKAVYLTKANNSIQYDAWLCGGALVSPRTVITSAACVEDVKYLYVIAGYRKYVNYEELNDDPCTKRMKKKIVYKCIPSEYRFDYPRTSRWANIDIALVNVEKAFNFSDPDFTTFCSYQPTVVEVNYNEKLQLPGMDAVVFGWGHSDKWRSIEDTADYNQDELRYGTVKLAPKENCMKEFNDTDIKTIIARYMICSITGGRINDVGDELDKDGNDGKDGPEDTVFMDNCGPKSFKLNGKCVEMKNSAPYYMSYRRRGICQNDHGGPIIAWKGPKEVLIGVASVFKVDEESKKCTPPFLYTSTFCNGAFIHCLLSEEMNETTITDPNIKLRCDELAKNSGYSIIRRSISWSEHPDGPAYNERHSNRGRGYN